MHKGIKKSLSLSALDKYKTLTTADKLDRISRAYSSSDLTTVTRTRKRSWEVSEKQSVRYTITSLLSKVVFPDKLVLIRFL